MEIVDLEIGSPVFIMSKNDGVIYPGIVYKQTINKSIKGESSVWMIMVGPQDNRKIITTDNLENYSLFKNIFELKDALFQQVMSTIETSVKDATTNLKKWYENEIPLPILAKALQATTKSSTAFKEAKNMSFSELAGKEATKDLYEKATNELKKKKPGRKARLAEVEQLSPVELDNEENENSQTQEAPVQTDATETKIRVKVKGPDGTFRLVDADDIQSVNDIEF